MGDRLTEEKEPQASLTPYGDIFDECLPHYMAMGMTYDEYWDGEVGMKTAYRNAHRIRMETQQRMEDQNGWLMGQYVMAALQCVPLLVGGLNVKRTTKLPEYPNKPFLEKQAELRREEDKRKHEEDQMKLAMALFQSQIAAFNKRFAGKQKAGASGQ